MDPWVVDAVLKLIGKRAAEGLKRLEIEFFGGEPLAAWDVLVAIAKEASHLCASTGTDFVAGITTNATRLTAERLSVLLEYGVKNFQITLDGPKPIHDTRRVTHTGKGTFEQVWHALELIKNTDSDVDVIIRLHYDPDTFPMLVRPDGFLNELVERLVKDDSRFRIMFQVLGRLGGANDANISVFSREDGQAALQQLTDRALQLGATPYQIPQWSAGPLGESGLEVCYAARANAFVIRPNGDIAKCTVALQDQRNRVGRLTSTGELQIDHEKHLPWLKGLLTGNPLQLTCPALDVIWGK
jgi:uncharacterized protein